MSEMIRFANSLIRGVSVGLERFTGHRTRIALMLQLKAQRDIALFDPDGLVADRVDDIKQKFGANGGWPKLARDVEAFRLDAYYPFSSDLEHCLTVGRQSATIYAQRWFCTRHQGLCSKAPLRQFLERAAILFEILYAGRKLNPQNLDRAFQHDLEFFTFHAIRTAVREVFANHTEQDITFTVQEVLTTIQRISRSREEKQPPSGIIVFVNDPSTVRRMVGLDDQPPLNEYKRILKLLTATDPRLTSGGSVLVSDGERAVGIAHGTIEESCLKAIFHRGRGRLLVCDRPICTFQEGVFDARSHRRDNSTFADELKLTLNSEPPVLKTSTQCDFMAKAVQPIIEAAQKNRYGCTIVIDSSPNEYAYSGELLAHPLRLTRRKKINLKIAKGLARMDGALVVGTDRRLYAGGCILGGLEDKDLEDRSHGARHNAAIRFTRHREETVAITVSEDGPVSIYSRGRNVLRGPDEEVTTRNRRTPILWRDLFT